VVVLNEGKILLTGTFEDLQNSSNPFIARFLSEAA
jgi:hypothetical protein